MSKKRTGFYSGYDFLAPSGVQHTGRTYEDFYSVVSEGRPAERMPVAEFTPPEPGRSYGKGAAAGAKKQRHRHDWLIRHDYMQCRSCGKLITVKERGSVDA